MRIAVALLAELSIVPYLEMNIWPRTVAAFIGTGVVEVSKSG